MDTSDARDYYDRYWRVENWETRPPKKLVELLGRHVVSSDRCVDVGCGDGGTTGVWLNHHVAHYVGVDVSETAVEMARKRGLDARCVADAGALPFDDDSFDVAICVEVLEHLFQPQVAAAEMRRVVRPGGHVIVTVPNAAHWRNRLDGIAGRWNPRGDHLSAVEPWRDAHLRFFTYRSLTRLIDSCKLTVIERGGYVEFPIAQYLPGARRLVGSSSAGALSRRLAEVRPQIFAGNLYVVGEVGGASDRTHGRAWRTRPRD